MLDNITISEIRDIRSDLGKNLELLYKEYRNGNDISRIIRTVIIALKLYPDPMWYDGIKTIENEAKSLRIDIEETPDAHSQEILYLFEELVTLKNCIFSNKNSAKSNMDNLSIKSLVYDSGYYAKTIGKTLSIIDYCGSNKNIVIPEKIAGLPVTAIEDYAFLRKNLTKVTFNSNIVSIGESAFFKSNITSIEFAEGIESIGKDAFHLNKLPALNLPMSVIHIGESAFAQNEITSLSLPNGSTFIGEGAFKENKINSLSLPEGISIIRETVYYNNELTSVIIPKSVTEIGYCAFSLNRLKKISIPGNVKLKRINDLDSFVFDDYYNKNKKRGGIYTFNGSRWENEDEPQLKKWVLKNLSLKKWLNDRELSRDEKILSKYGPTVAMSKSRYMMKLKRKMAKKTDPIPKEVWEKMEEKLKKHIKAVIKKGDAVVTYTPKIPDDVHNSGDFSSMLPRCDTISVYYGPLYSRTYEVESGHCIMMS